MAPEDVHTHKNAQPVIALVRIRFPLLQGKEDLPQMNHPSFKCKQPSSFQILKQTIPFLIS